MDLTALVYGLNEAHVPPRPATHIDEEAEIARPRPKPLREPRPISANDRFSSIEPHSTSDTTSDAVSDAASDADLKHPRSKHDSFDFAGSVFLITGEGKTLNLPVPSESRNDPLNWNLWKTGGAMFAVGFYSAVALTAVQAQSLMFNGIIAEFGHEITPPWSPQTLVTAPTLFIGLGTFFWVPLSLALGRRPVFLISTFIHLLAMIAAGFSRTFMELVVANCVLGLCEGLPLSLALLMVIDMTFIAQRPKAIALLWSVAGLFGTGGLAFVPFLSGSGDYWRSFYLRWSPTSAAALLFAYFLFPETYFKRPTVAFDGMILIQSATEKLTVYADLEVDSDIYRDLPNFDVEKPGLLHRIGLGCSPCGSWKAMARCYPQMLFCMINPLIFWVLIAASFNFAGMLFIGATFAAVLAAPPYNMASTQIPIVNVSAGVGGLFGYFIAGYGMSKVLNRLSKRNGGVREAEHYLVGHVIPTVTGCLSTLLYGVAVHYTLPFYVYCIAYGINGLSWVSLAIVNTLWVTEAFPRWAAPAMAVVTGGCYLMSFTMSFALGAWVESHGYLILSFELTGLQFVGGLIALPIAFWGKSARQKIHGRWTNDRSGALRPL